MSDTDAPALETLEPLGDALADITEMPEVSDHVVNAEPAPSIAPEPSTGQAGESNILPSRPKDKRGDSFDPDLHAVDSDGKPRLTLSGYFAKKRGRKAGHKSNVNAPGSDRAQKSPEQERAETDNKVMGETAAALTINLGQAFGGDEWEPKIDDTTGINEAKYLAAVWGDWFKSKNIDDIPPNTALVLGLAYYVVPRLSKPKTRGRLKEAFSSGFNWLKNKSKNIGKNNKKKR